MQEFSAVGIDLPSLMQQRGMEFHYSEFGIGGEGVRGQQLTPGPYISSLRR